MKPIGINQFAPPAADPYWNAVVFATHADGPNGKGNGVFLDSSPAGLTPAMAGRAPQGSFSPYAAGGGSAYFENGNYMYIVDGANLGFGAGDWTFECWIYPTVTGAQSVVDFRPSGGNGPQFQFGHTNGTIALTVDGVTQISGGALPLNTWAHVAFSRVAGNTRMFLNGVQTGVTWADATNYTQPATRPIIGASGFSQGSAPFPGFIADLRLIKGTGLYAANFTPPVAPLTAVAGTGLLLSFTNASLVDAARKGNAKTVNVITSTDQAKFGPASVFSQDGVALDGAFVPNINSLYAMGTGDFTFEAWVYPQDLTGARSIWDCRVAAGAYPTLNLVSGRPLYIANSATQIDSGAALPANAWSHVALCRVAGQTRLFVNGVQMGVTYADATNYLCGSVMGVGGATIAGGLALKGYLDDVRLTKGVGRYATNFTPPTQAFSESIPAGADPYGYAVNLLLHGDGTAGAANATFVDSSANANVLAVVGPPPQGSAAPYEGMGSAYFDGTLNMQVSATNGAPLQFGTGDFTMEGWVWIAGNVGADDSSQCTQCMVSNFFDTGGFNWFEFSILGNTTTTGTGVRFQFGSNTGADTIDGVATVTQKAWHHVAVAKQGTTVRVFLDGVLLGTGVPTRTVMSPTGRTQFGWTQNPGAARPLFGYLSNFRISKGIARYTATFPLPTAPVASDANTSLLLNFANAGVVDSARKKDLRTHGATALSAAQSKFGGSSISVPGAGAGLSLPSGTELVFGTGDFTVEMWFRPTSTGAVNTLWGQYPGSGLIALEMYVGTNGALNVQTVGAGSSITAPALTIAANTWYHIALSRVAGVTRLFVDGVQKGVTYTDPNNYVAPTWTGIGLGGQGGSPANGFFDDVRITKGVGRYAANFTPPTAPFPNP